MADQRSADPKDQIPYNPVTDPTELDRRYQIIQDYKRDNPKDVEGYKRLLQKFTSSGPNMHPAFIPPDEGARQFTDDQGNMVSIPTWADPYRPATKKELDLPLRRPVYRDKGNPNVTNPRILSQEETPTPPIINTNVAPPRAKRWPYATAQGSQQ